MSIKGKQYIESHPKSYLAKAIADANWEDEKIEVGSGLITENPNSNLQNLLKWCESSDYVVGGRAGKNRNDGYHFAVLVKNKSVHG